MKRFKSARQAQRFLSAHDQINNLFISAVTTFPPASIEQQGGVRLRCGPRSAGLLPPLELRATVAPARPRDDNLTVPSRSIAPPLAASRPRREPDLPKQDPVPDLCWLAGLRTMKCRVDIDWASPEAYQYTIRLPSSRKDYLSIR